jgi:serine/threonine-protein kinase
MRFLAAVLRKRASSLFDIVLNQTGPSLADRARTVALLALLRDELRRRDSDGNITEFRVLNSQYELFTGEMVNLFAEVDRAPDLDARTRAEAAEAWERLGDVSRLRTPADPDYWVDLGQFQIGRYPATVWEYGKFVEAGGAEPEYWKEQSLWPHRPVVGMNWQQAMDYCQWAGVRLQTSEQWEFAAAGAGGRKYPWGSEEPDKESDTERANFDDRVGRVTPVGLFPSGRTPDGVADLAGNVWEWTSSDYDANAKVLRGGAFVNDARALLAAYRNRNHPDNRNNNIGFRCVRDVERGGEISPQAGAGKVTANPGVRLHFRAARRTQWLKQPRRRTLAGRSGLVVARAKPGRIADHSTGLPDGQMRPAR